MVLSEGEKINMKQTASCKTTLQKKDRYDVMYENLEKKHHEFLDQLLQNCNIDRETGKFYCKKCQNLVHID